MRELHPRPRWIVAQQGREPINHGNTECRAYYPGIEDSGDAVLACCRSRNLKKEKWPTSEGKNNRHDGPVGHERADADGLRFGHRAADEHRQPEEQCDHDHALRPHRADRTSSYRSKRRTQPFPPAAMMTTATTLTSSMRRFYRLITDLSILDIPINPVLGGDFFVD